VIPFSLIVACGFVWARGGSMNTLVLLGLIVAIGMLVDNAVVVMGEHLPPPGAGREPAGRRATAPPRCHRRHAATLTSVIVFLPLIFNKPSEMNIYLKARHRGVS
jgi:multidrug efflux pump